MSYNDKRTVYDGKVTILVPATLGVVPLFVAGSGVDRPVGSKVQPGGRPERVRISELALGQTSADSSCHLD
jgi:hypothetical protein